MEEIANIGVLFIASFGPIVRDAAASRKLYSHILAIPFKEEKGGYLHTEGLEGVKTFALWPLSEGRSILLREGFVAPRCSCPASLD